MVLPIALALLQLAINSRPSAALAGRFSDERPAMAAADSEKSTANSSADAPNFDAVAADASASPASASDPSAASPEPGVAIPAAPEPLPAVVLSSSSKVSFVPVALPAARISPLLSVDEQADKERRWMERQKRIWLALSIGQSGAAAFDAWSTRLVVASGRGTELNPMLRPFAGNGSLYAAIQVAPVLIDYLSRRMLTSHHGWMRRTWWIPQATGTVLSIVSGARNVGVYNGQ